MAPVDQGLLDSVFKNNKSWVNVGAYETVSKSQAANGDELAGLPASRREAAVNSLKWAISGALRDYKVKGSFSVSYECWGQEIFPQTRETLAHTKLQGKDLHGQILYSAERLEKSPSAQLLLNAAADLQDAYSRLPLLASPSTSHKLAEHVRVEWAEKPCR